MPTTLQVPASVLASPDDDAPRLAYARELRDRGDPRGEFIEARCSLARCPSDTADALDRRASLVARSKALLAAHEEAWLAPLGLRSQEAQWARGFVDEVTLAPERLDELSARLVAGAPVRSLHFTGLETAGDLARSLEDPLCRRVTSLDLQHVYKHPGRDIGAAGARLLHEAPHLRACELSVSFGRPFPRPRPTAAPETSPPAP